MKTIISLVIFLVVGLAGSRGLFSQRKHRLPITVVFLSGIEFFFIGVLLGPHFLDVISTQAIDNLKPVVYLALGWAGILFGIQLSWRRVRGLSRGVFNVLAADGFLSIAICSIVFFFLLHRVFPRSAPAEITIGALVLSITASVSSPTIVALLSQRLPSRGQFTRLAGLLSALSGVLPLFAFGLLFTFAHPGFFAGYGVLTDILWWIFANVVGIVMAFVLVLLALRRCTAEERLLLIMGTVILAGGFCYFLKLSVLYTSMIMGIVVGNLARRKQLIFRQLQALENTLYVIFLIIVGAMISIPGLEILLVLASYLALRLLLRFLMSSWLMKVNFPVFSGLGRRSGLVLSAQGGLALTIVLDYRYGVGGELADVIVAVTSLAVVSNEILSVFLTRRAFEASGEVAPSRQAEGAGNPAGK